MEPILYVETNFVLCVAKGQDVFADGLVRQGFPGLRVVLPVVCVTESLVTLEAERKARNGLHDQLRKHAREAGRDQTSGHAPVLARHLEDAVSESERQFHDIEFRLKEVLRLLVLGAETIPLDLEIYQESLDNEYLEDPADNLILCSVITHALRNGAVPKAFLSENHHDFDRPFVRSVLGTVGVRYFRWAEAAVGWLRSQGRPETGANP